MSIFICEDQAHFTHCFVINLKFNINLVLSLHCKLLDDKKAYYFLASSEEYLRKFFSRSWHVTLTKLEINLRHTKHFPGCLLSRTGLRCQIKPAQGLLSSYQAYHLCFPRCQVTRLWLLTAGGRAGRHHTSHTKGRLCTGLSFHNGTFCN